MISLRPWFLPASAATVMGIMTVASAWMLAERQARPPIVIEGIDANATIVVVVEGAVNTPGVYALPGDARMQQAIDAAGGLAGDADPGRVNLAARVRDEDRLVIPSQGRGQIVASAITVEKPTAASGLVDINTATAAELDMLAGIGPVLAARIVTYRETYGPFRTIEELARVDGISAGTVDELRDAIVAGP